MNIAVFDSSSFQLFLMLACIAIIICFFIFQYSRGTDITNPEAKIQKIHTFYVSGILVFIIIELVTAICMGGDNSSTILSFVSFAATLSSLIMSVVAIIFTIVSGSRGDQTFKKIDNASDKVTESLSKFSEKTERLDESIQGFNATADALSGKMSSILEIVSGVDKTSREVLNQIRNAQPSEATDIVLTKGRKKLNELNDFIAYSSYSGKLALLACVLSKDNSHPFCVKDISQNEDDEAYKYGYIIASISAGILNVKPTNNRIIEVTDYVEGLKESLEKSIQEVLSSDVQMSDEVKQTMYNLVITYFKQKK